MAHIVLRLLVCSFILLGAFGCGYSIGRSRAVVKEIEKRVEVIKYVEKQKAAIHAKPNAGRDELLSLMRAGKF